MRSARFILACAAVSALAACGTDTITAPQKPAEPKFDSQYGSGQSVCNGTMVTTVNPDGSITVQCVIDGKSQYGSGQ